MDDRTDGWVMKWNQRIHNLLAVCLSVDHVPWVSLLINKLTFTTRRQPSGSADYFDNVMTKFIVNNRTDA